MKKEKQSFCVTIYGREKYGTQPISSYMVYLISWIWVWVKIVFVSVSAKLKCQFLFLLIIKIKEGFKMVKRNISFYERKKINNINEFFTKGKVHILRKFLFSTFGRWEIRSSYDSKILFEIIFYLAWNTMFSEYWKVLVLNFLKMGNTVFFWSKKLMKSWYFLQQKYHVFWTF